jgi:hypothetical protein
MLYLFLSHKSLILHWFEAETGCVFTDRPLDNNDHCGMLGS